LTSLALPEGEGGYPHELWTTRLLARHARKHGRADGHPCLPHLARARCARSSTSAAHLSRDASYADQPAGRFGFTLLPSMLLRGPLLQARPVRSCQIRVSSKQELKKRLMAPLANLARPLQRRSCRSHLDLEARQGRLI
jgi:hypothetical protein